MSKTDLSYAPEYRRQMVELVRAGRTAGELARVFGCCAQTIRNWVRQAAGANRAPSWGVDRWFLNERCGAPERNRKRVVAGRTLKDGGAMVRQGLAWMRGRFNESAFILITD